MKIIDEIKKIKLILKDFKQLKPSEEDYFKYKYNILTGVTDPPHYIVKILLLGILRFKNYGGGDKVTWHTYLQYKGHKFEIHDFKFGTWSIKSTENDEETLKLANEIYFKINRASKLLDKLLYNSLKYEIKSQNFYLNNVYHKLHYIYEFYKKKVQDKIKEYERLDNICNEKNFMVIYDKIMEISKEISAYSFALIQSFFSLVEFLLDVFYAFEQPSIDFFEFRNRDWSERFKIIFNLEKEKDIKQIYDQIIEIKRKYRNPLAHGLYNEANLLIRVPNIGLIPLSYNYLLNEVYYGFIEIVDINNAISIINTFENFFTLLWNKTPYKFYMLYVSYGFPIPMNKTAISKIKDKMTTYDNFREYLERYVEWFNYFS